MHIGFDAKRLFHNFTGLGNYSRTLVAHLRKHYPEMRLTLFTPKGQFNARTEPFFDEDDYQLCEGGGAAWRTWSVYKDINQYDPDIFHGLSHEIPFSSDKMNCKTVVTVHDLIHRIRPRDFSRIDRMIYERKCKYACANADKIIAISENTKADIVKYYRVDANRIDVVYQSCDPQFMEPVAQDAIDETRKLFSLPEEYFLYVGSVVPRKNLLAIVQALQAMPSEDRLPLMILGSGRKYMGKVVRYVQKNGLEEWVHFLGDVPFRLFPAIYSQSKALIYPSLYEGFGLPVIEALSVGVPVITSNTSSLPEAGGQACIYVDPTDKDSMIAAMMKVREEGQMSDDCVRMRKAHAAHFASDVTATTLRQSYERVL